MFRLLNVNKRKSLRIILLAAIVTASPLESHSCKKIGGGGWGCTSNRFMDGAKSFIALLLPHLFAVSPLLHYSYKKMGGGGLSEWDSTVSQAILEIFPVLEPLRRTKFSSRRPMVQDVTAAGRERDMSHGARHGGLCYRSCDLMANWTHFIELARFSVANPQARQKS
jgi:hypothetical protein